MDFKEQKPIYRQIADFLLERILRLELSANDRIQSVRDLAKEVQVNPNTVVRAYSFLNEAGIIQNKRGIGYFTTDNALQLTRQLKKDEFIKEQLPSLIKNMKLLDIDFDDLQLLIGEIKPKFAED